jgi:stage II sporulation protein D
VRGLLLATLALWALASHALAAPGNFKVELFSGRVVKSLSLLVRSQHATLCSTEGTPCLRLGPGDTALCARAGAAIHCSSSTSTLEFRALRVESASPLRAEVRFAAANTPPPTITLRSVEVTPLGNGLRVVTHVDLEAYVSGVLAGEASVFKTPAAREAMAIVARTWALRWRGRHGTEGFDFCSLTHCQVFRPPRSGGANGSGLEAAARATRGQVLMFQGRLIDPYFTACCGGATESAANLWPDRAEPYLVSIRDPYCLGSAHASWQRVLPLETLEKILRSDLGMSLNGPLAELVVEKIDSTGRALTLRAVAGSAWPIDANQFRYTLNRRLGWATLKSNLYTIGRQENSLVFSGHGLGHGVGLCQAGAEQMGRLGFSAGRILSAYFPGTDIQSLDRQDPVASSEHFELFFPASQEPWVRPTLDSLEEAYRASAGHAEALRQRVRVKTWETTREFVRATGQPAWSAAANDGRSIALQPLVLLARKGILKQTARHEVTHLVVHRLRAPGVPDWFEEGLVLYLTHEQINEGQAALHAGRTLDEAIRKPRSEAEMQAAYRLALEPVRELARQQGEAGLWRALEHPTAEDLLWLRSER